MKNEKGNLKRFLRELKKEVDFCFDQAVVCMEHTGIYNFRALEVLHKCKIKVCLEPALHIKKSQGMTRGKDDRVDARRIALYAYKNRQELTFWQPQRLIIQKL